MSIARVRVPGDPQLTSCLAERLGQFARLSHGERDALERLEEHERGFRRGAVVIAEGEAGRELFVVRSGWLHSSVMLGNGSRQIKRFHFSGDIVGLPLLAFTESPETLTAVTDLTLAGFSREKLASLIGDQPRLGMLLLALTLAERVSLADRMASIGRTSARMRVSSLLCEIWVRLRRAGLAKDGYIQLPLTQEDIGDATGLTAVHVNRMMRALSEDGLIERNSGHFRVLDEARLCTDGNFVDRTSLSIDWLPQPM